MTPDIFKYLMTGAYALLVYGLTLFLLNDDLGQLGYFVGGCRLGLLDQLCIPVLKVQGFHLVDQYSPLCFYAFQLDFEPDASSAPST